MPDSKQPPSKIDLDEDVDSLPVGLYEKQAIQLARIDPVWHGEYVFGWHAQPCHEEWQDLCTAHNRLVIFAPVEHGKSSQVSVNRLSWEIGQNINLRSALVSNTAGQSEKFLGVIKQTITFNERYGRVFPHVKPERRRGRVKGWHDFRIVVQREDLTNKDNTVQAIGLMGNILGARLDLAILDDVLDFENTLTKTQRQRTIGWHKTTIVSRMYVGGRIWLIGNAWDIDDLMHWCEENPSYFTKRYDAEDDLWPSLEIMSTGEVVGWPKSRREERKKEVRIIEYNRSMRNIAQKERASDDFNRRDIEVCVEMAERDGERLMSHYSDNAFLVYVGVDLAVAKKRSSAETVFFVIGLDGRGVKHVLHISAGRWSLVDIVREFCRIQLNFKPVLFMVENNAAQKYIEAFLRESDEILAAIILDGGPDVQKIRTITSQIRVQGFTTGKNKADPTYGVRAMSIDFAARKWRIPRGSQTEAWIKEMTTFTPVEHTGDRLMASWFGDRACTKGTGGRIKAYSISAGGE